ncbi:MAG: hypothetical protein ACF8LK_07125 [Phycisphaerales bacterium JB041]
MALILLASAVVSFVVMEWIRGRPAMSSGRRFKLLWVQIGLFLGLIVWAGVLTVRLFTRS